MNNYYEDIYGPLAWRGCGLISSRARLLIIPCRARSRCLSVMPSSCCAIGCTQRVSKANGIKMFRFPIDPERRKAWVDAIKRVEWQPKAHSRVCSAHLISG